MHFEELRVYQLGKRLRQELHDEVITIPHHWDIKEVDQVIRSSSSSVSNIVEGHGRKFYPKDNYRFLTISLASTDETQDHIEALKSKKHLTNSRFEYYKKSYKTLAVQTLNYMNAIRKRHNL